MELKEDFYQLGFYYLPGCITTIRLLLRRTLVRFVRNATILWSFLIVP